MLFLLDFIYPDCGGSNLVVLTMFSVTGPTKTLFVKGLSEDTSDQTLKDSFDGAAAARIVTDRETGSSKG